MLKNGSPASPRPLRYRQNALKVCEVDATGQGWMGAWMSSTGRFNHRFAIIQTNDIVRDPWSSARVGKLWDLLRNIRSISYKITILLLWDDELVETKMKCFKSFQLKKIVLCKHKNNIKHQRHNPVPHIAFAAKKLCRFQSPTRFLRSVREKFQKTSRDMNPAWFRCKTNC